jgi:hypothetical protein
MSARTLLAELEAAGMRLSLAGDDLRFQTRPGVSIAPYRERILANKPALLATLRQHEAATLPGTPRKSGRPTPGEAAAQGLDPTLEWAYGDPAPVAATRPPAGWRGVLCDGCQWPELCRMLGPRGPHLPGGPCAAWPRVEQPPHG